MTHSTIRLLQLCILFGLISSGTSRAQPAPAPLPTPTPIEDLISEASARVTANISSPQVTTGGATASLTPDTFTGNARYTVSFPVPATRGYDPPSPTLSYNARGPDSVVGRGWRLDFGSLVRVSPQDGGGYQHQSALGSTSLVHTSGEHYRPSINPAYTTYTKHGTGNDTYWTMSDRNGTTYEFGTDSASRVNAAPADEAWIWLLRRISDPNGNVVEFTYTLVENFPLLQDITYGMHYSHTGTRDISAYIKFHLEYERRPDQFSVHFATSRFNITQRIKRLSLEIRGAVERLYELRYIQSTHTSASLLAAINEITVSGDQRELYRFSYADPPSDFSPAAALVPASPRGDDELRWTGTAAAQMAVVDLEGNGLPEVCIPEGTNYICRHFNGQFSAVGRVLPSPAVAADWGNSSQSLIRVIDVNRDGQNDICMMQENGVNCWLNDHGEFHRAWPGPKWPLSDRISAGSLRFGDLNGDHIPDLCRLAEDNVECVLGGQNGFDLDVSHLIKGPKWKRLVAVAPPGFPVKADAQWSRPEHYTSLTLIDIDGDGLDDVCGRERAGIVCYRSSGTAFELGRPITGPQWADAPPPTTPAPGAPPAPPAGPGTTPPPTDWAQAEHYGTISYADINGDYLPDICARDRVGIECYLNVGGSFDLGHAVRGVAWPDPPAPPGGIFPVPTRSTWKDPGRWRTIAFVDVNSDGKADVCGRLATGYECHLSTGTSFGAVQNGPALADNYEGDWLNQEYFSTLRFVDINSDGAIDLCARTNRGIRCWTNRDAGADRLSVVKDYLGSELQLTYASKSALGDSRIPFALPVVATVERYDGRHTTSIEKYEYHNGHYSTPHHDFRGFASVQIAYSDASSGAVRWSRLRYSQGTATEDRGHDDPDDPDAPTKGRVLSSKIGGYDTPETEDIAYRYTITSRKPGFAIAVNRVMATRCMGEECAVRSLTEYVTDPANGNTLEEDDLNDPASPVDDLSKTFAYASNSNGNVTSLPAIVRSYRGVGTRQLISEIRYGYDEDDGCDPDVALSRGQPISDRVDVGHVTSVWTDGLGVERRLSLAGYDDFGNAVCAYTAPSGLTRTRFDAAT